MATPSSPPNLRAEGLTAAYPHAARRILSTHRKTYRDTFLVVSLLAGLDGSHTVREIADHRGINPGNARRHLDHLEALALIERTRPGPGHPYTYRVHPDRAAGFSQIPAGDVSVLYARARTVEARRAVASDYAKYRPASAGRYGNRMRWHAGRHPVRPQCESIGCARFRLGTPTGNPPLSETSPPTHPRSWPTKPTRTPSALAKHNARQHVEALTEHGYRVTHPDGLAAHRAGLWEDAVVAAAVPNDVSCPGSEGLAP